MTSYVTSLDGTRIAFDRIGQGAPVVIVSGMFCDRQTTQNLAEQLAQHFSVINYDRRGRGDSGDTDPYAIEREIDDLGVLIAEAGGAASVYGHSSGAGLALNAAASGLPITRLVLHEPPYGLDDELSKRSARKLAENVQAALDDDRRADAIKLFMGNLDMPPELVEGMTGDPKMIALAPTMSYDFEIMGNTSRGGTIPERFVRAISIPTMVIAGGKSPEFFRDTAARIVDLLPNGAHTVLEGQDHGAPADVVAPVVVDFFANWCRGKSEEGPSTMDERAVRELYEELLEAWNRRNAHDYAGLFSDDGFVVGFDGSSHDDPQKVESDLSRIFSDYRRDSQWTYFPVLHAQFATPSRNWGRLSSASR